MKNSLLVSMGNSNSSTSVNHWEQSKTTAGSKKLFTQVITVWQLGVPPTKVYDHKKKKRLVFFSEKISRNKKFWHI